MKLTPQFSEGDDIFFKQVEADTKKAQALVDDCKARINRIEAVELTETSFKQRAYLQNIIDVVVNQNQIGQRWCDTFDKQWIWGLEQHIEMLQLKKELRNLKESNSLILKHTRKLNGRKIITNIPTFDELYGFATREAYSKQVKNNT